MAEVIHDGIADRAPSLQDRAIGWLRRFWPLIVGIPLVAYLSTQWPSSLKPIKWDELNLGSLLMTLFLAALFIERSLEIYIRAFRGHKRGEITSRIDNAETDIAELKSRRDADPTNFRSTDSDQLVALLAELGESQDALLAHRSRSEAIALQVGLFLGLIVSMAGLRTFGVLMTSTALSSTTVLGMSQATVFSGVDVVLTAGLLGGGSKGIHALTQVIGNSMDLMADVSKKKPVA